MKKPQSIQTLLKMLVYTAWMVTFVVLLLSGRYKMHIAIHLWPIIAGGAILSGLFLTFLALSQRLFRKEEESRADLVDVGILLFPLIYLVFSTGDQLGAYAYFRRSVSMVESLDGIEFQTGSSELQDTVMHTDLYSLLSDYGNAFERTVTLEGSLIHTHSISDNRSRQKIINALQYKKKRTIHRMPDELGEDLGSEVSEALSRLEAGEDPEKIERELEESGSGMDNSAPSRDRGLYKA